MKAQEYLDIKPEYPDAKRYSKRFFTVKKTELKNLQKNAERQLDILDRAVKKATKENQLTLALAYQKEHELVRLQKNQLMATLTSLIEDGVYISPSSKKKATLYITCDDEFKVWINGELVPDLAFRLASAL